jgi:hypothetical protein
VLKRAADAMGLNVTEGNTKYMRVKGNREQIML